MRAAAGGQVRHGIGGARWTWSIALTVLLSGCTLAPNATWTTPRGEVTDTPPGGRVLPDDDTRAPVTTYVIDRITDGAWAVLEDASGATRDVPLDWLPAEVEEGDVVLVTVQRTEAAAPAEGPTRQVSFRLDREATARRRDGASELRDGLRKAPSGDLDL